MCGAALGLECKTSEELSLVLWRFIYFLDVRRNITSFSLFLCALNYHHH